MTNNKISIMGILNVTPDSFSDGGHFDDLNNALTKARTLIQEGVDIIDIGGESTRPGAKEVHVDTELDRVIPVIRTIKNLCLDNNIKISVDTRKSLVMKEAIKEGADIINDVTALTFDNKSIDIVSNSQSEICLMHMQNSPENMQDNPYYNDIISEIYDYLNSRINQCIASGISKDKIIIDPGIGFGKTLNDNFKIFNNLSKFNELGVRVMLGASRKSFIDKISPNNTPPDRRVGGSLAAVAMGINRGVSIFRVHDVFETKQFIDVYNKEK